MGDLLFRRAWVVLFLLCASGLPIVSAKADKKGKEDKPLPARDFELCVGSLILLSPFLSFFLSFSLNSCGVYQPPSVSFHARPGRSISHPTFASQTSTWTRVMEDYGRGRMAGRSRARISVRSRAMRNPRTTAGQANMAQRHLVRRRFYFLFSFSVHDLLFYRGFRFSSSSTLTLYIFLFAWSPTSFRL